jgi:hypothetical protein
MIRDTESAIRFLRKNWGALQLKARKLFEEHGRGTFLLTIPCAERAGLKKALRYLPKAKIPKTPTFVYLGVSVATYNPERTVVCMIIDSRSQKGDVRTLSEDKYGRPLDDKGKADPKKPPKRPRKIAPPIVLSKLDSASAKDFDGLLDALDDKISRSGVEKLPPRERMVWDVMTLKWEVDNGGLDQYFTNTGDRSASVLAGLQAIGATEVLAIFRKACHAFPHGVPSTDPEEEDEELYSIPKSKVAAWHKLDRKLHAAMERFPGLLWKFWKAE